MPSSTARRKGVPWVYSAPKYVSQVSRCASKWSSATGPCFLAIERSSGSAMVWSPPRVIRRAPVARSASADASMVSTASLMLNGLAAMSPASATWARAKGDASWAGLYGRSRRDASRMALPPKRAPGR